LAAVYLKLSSLSDERHGADGHDGDDGGQGETGWVGPTPDQPEDPGVGGEQPLPDVPGCSAFVANLNKTAR